MGRLFLEREGMKRVALIVVLLAAAGCVRREVVIDPAACEPARAQFLQAYFTFVQQDDIDAMLYMFAGPKPIESLGAETFDEAYRLVVLPAYHRPVLITVAVRGERATLNLRVAESLGCDVHHLVTNKTIRLSRTQLEGLRAVIDENPFWNRVIADHIGRDGTQIGVEVKRDGPLLHAVEWNPEGDLLNIAMYLMQVSGYSVGAQE